MDTHLIKIKMCDEIDIKKLLIIPLNTSVVNCFFYLFNCFHLSILVVDTRKTQHISNAYQNVYKLRTRRKIYAFKFRNS